MLWVILLIGLIVAVLIYWEYSHNGKTTNNLYDEVRKSQKDDPLRNIDNIQRAMKSDSEYSSWRLSLVVGILAALPIIYYIEGRIPTLFEWFIVGGLIFISTYLSSSWIWTHLHQPNNTKIEKYLVRIRDGVSKLVLEYEQKQKNNSYSNINQNSFLDLNANGSLYELYPDILLNQ